MFLPTLASSDILRSTMAMRSATTTMTTSSFSPTQEQPQNMMTKKNKKSITTTSNKITVRFNKIVTIKETLHKNNYTEQEKEACWVTPAEKKSTRKRICTALQQMKLSSCNLPNNKNNDIEINSNPLSCSSSLFSSSYCMRGLENYIWSESIKLRRQNAVFAVLDEQYRQYENAKLIMSNRLQQKEKMLQQQQDHHRNDLTNLLAEDGENTSIIFAIDDIKIRDVYKKHTLVCETIACYMGGIDASSAIGMDNDDENNWKTMKRKKEWKMNDNNDTKKMMMTMNPAA